MANITLVGISGSLRKASRNTGLLRCCAAHLPQGVSLEIADISALPLYNADMEKPAAAQSLIDLVTAAAGLVLDLTGRLPLVGDHVNWQGWRIEVVDLDGRRIDKLLVSRLPR